jgi:hypothetical protein
LSPKRVSDAGPAAGESDHALRAAGGHGPPAVRVSIGRGWRLLCVESAFGIGRLVDALHASGFRAGGVPEIIQLPWIRSPGTAAL